jgi:amino acid transporter
MTLYITIACFTLAVLGGITLATLRIKRRNIPRALPIMHGLAGATGIILIIVVMVQADAPTFLLTSLGFFVAAALSGLYLANVHRNRKGSTAIFISAHALLALCGLLMLLIYTFEKLILKSQ